jgi:hypothetical protein
MLALFHAALVGVPVDVQRQKDIASIVGPDRSPHAGVLVPRAVGGACGRGRGASCQQS